MDVLTKSEIKEILDQSAMMEKYAEDVDRESAYEILSAKIEDARQSDRGRSTSRRRREKSTLEQVLDNTTTRQIGRTVARELTRGLLGVLGVKTTSRRRKKTTFPWL